MMNDPAMLRALRATPMLVPLPIPLKTASGMITASPLVLVDLETDTGCTGHAYLFVYSPLALRPVVQIINALGSELVGSAVAPAELLLNLSCKFRLLGTAGLLGMGGLCGGQVVQRRVSRTASQLTLGARVITHGQRQHPGLKALQGGVSMTCIPPTTQARA